MKTGLHKQDAQLTTAWQNRVTAAWWPSVLQQLSAAWKHWVRLVYLCQFCAWRAGMNTLAILVESSYACSLNLLALRSEFTSVIPYDSLLSSYIPFTLIMPRICTDRPNCFCYICGEVTFKYENTDGKVSDENKNCDFHVCFIICVRLLTTWTKYTPFAIPMSWREPSDHTSDCYFCMTNAYGTNIQNPNTL